MVIERYAASEVLGITAPCWRGSLHVNSDWYLLEPVDEQYQPVPRGTRSHTVLVTNLANLVQPLIRYDLGDRVELDADPCACGLPFPVVRLWGRSADVASFDGVDGRAVPVAPLALATVIEETPGVVRCQAVRTRARDLAVRPEIEQATDPAAVWSAVEGNLAAFFAEHRIAPVAVRHATEPPQVDPRTGKFRQVYSED